MPKLQAKDIIALVFLLIVLLFKFFGFESSFDATLALVLGYYFAHRHRGTDNGI